MQRPYLIFLLGSAMMLVVTFWLLPVFEFDTPPNPRAALPATCAAAGGLVFAFLALRQPLGWWPALAGLLMLLHGFLFASLLHGIYSDLHAARLTTRSSERSLAVTLFLYSESCVASLRR